MILFVSTKDTPPTTHEKQFSFVGFDFGLCEEDWTVYSSIFNEILFGSVNELVEYKKTLNDHFLFPNRVVAEQYAKLHRELFLAEKDVEVDDDMLVYGIWKYENKSA